MSISRSYIIGVITGVIASIFVEINKYILEHIVNLKSVNREKSFYDLSIYYDFLIDNSHDLLIFLGFSVFVATVFTSVIALIAFTDNRLTSRSFRKFDFLLRRLNEINAAGAELLDSVTLYINPIAREDKQASIEKRLFSSLREYHQNDAIKSFFSDALYKFLKATPAEFQGSPSVRTASIMLRKQYLDQRELSNETVSAEELFKDDSLEVVHYVDHRNLTPPLHHGHRSFRFYENGKESSAFGPQTVLRGTMRMGKIRSFNRFKYMTFLKRFENFVIVDGYDSGKKSILNIPLTNKKSVIIGIISVDSSEFQFTGNFNTIAHLGDILTNYIDKVEETLLALENAKIK